MCLFSCVQVLLKHKRLILKIHWGNTLTVQWLGLRAFTAVAWVPSLVGKLRSHKPRGGAKKKSQHLHSILSKATSLTLEGGRLKRTPQLIHGRDYEMVPEPVWRALYHWYGANLALPRPVSTANIALYKKHLQQGLLLIHYMNLTIHKLVLNHNRAFNTCSN